MKCNNIIKIITYTKDQKFNMVKLIFSVINEPINNFWIIIIKIFVLCTYTVLAHLN